MGKKEEKPYFVLKDLSRDNVSGYLKKKINFRKWLGHIIVGAPMAEAHTRIDFTGPPGSVSGIYYSLMFQLGKWEYKTTKFDEKIEVSPTHAQYYQLTHQQRAELEGRIKSGLVSVSQSIADLELLGHDERKYKEFLKYFGYKTKKENNEKYKSNDKDFDDADFIYLGMEEKEIKKNIDNHSLRAVFIDQIDVHTGEGISIRSIVSRWPTLITDFMKLSDDDIEPNKVKDKLDTSKAEAVILITKNRLFLQWKGIFGVEIKNRYKRILELVRSREKSIKSYREWLAPVIARHKVLDEGLSSSTSWLMIQGHALSAQEIEIWTWKDLLSPELYKMPGETLSRIRTLEKLSPYDDWTKENFIFNRKQGLIVDYPWITDKWVKDKLKEMEDAGWFNLKRHYYSFFIIKLEKTNLRMPTGSELEDGTFDVNAIFFSQNALFVKLLELKAKEQEFKWYVDKLMGIEPEGYPENENMKESGSDKLETIKKFFEWFAIKPLQFFKPAPYERDFNDRITKYYLLPMAKERYLPIVGFIKKKAGLGE